ncbi:MAG: helix-turn-helix domain-containing protein [Chthonomonadales bacterium]
MGRLFTTTEAALRLGVSRSRISEYKKRGWLKPTGDIDPIDARTDLYLEEDVYELAERRAQQQEDHPVGQGYRAHFHRWGNRADASRLPLMKQERITDTPDRYFTSREVAEMLGVAIGTVSGLAMRGLLPCYQKHPGKTGSRLYFRSWDIQCLYMNEEYQKYRRAYDSGRRGIRKESVEWEPIFGRVLSRDLGDDGRRAIKRNYGKYFSIRQAAKVLGVHISAVRRMVKAHRIPATHAKSWKKSEYAAVQMWLILKSDVFALLRDEDYLKRSARGKLNNPPRDRSLPKGERR